MTGGGLNTSGGESASSEREAYLLGETNSLLFFSLSLVDDDDKLRFEVLRGIPI
jgi:hypothetical protein